MLSCHVVQVCINIVINIILCVRVCVWGGVSSVATDKPGGVRQVLFDLDIFGFHFNKNEQQHLETCSR